MIQPQLIVLREGTDTSQGKPQLLSNINAILELTNTVKTTLGPFGMDKLIHNGQDISISNDGATVIKLLDVSHPIARVLVDIATAQDHEVGDGTTSVMIIAGELLRVARDCIDEGIAPQVIIKGYRSALQIALNELEKLATPFDATSSSVELQQCAITALNSKLIASEREFFAEIAVKAVNALDSDKSLERIGVKKVAGGSMRESLFVNGVAFAKTFSYAGFEQQPKKFENPKILLLNVELELKAERDNAEVRIKDPSQYQSIVNAEWDIIYEKLDKCVTSGAQVIFSRQPIGDLATQYFADRGLFCAGRVADDDIQRVALATGASIQSTVHSISPGVIGHCEQFEERQVGAERFNFMSGCPKARTATIVLRGGAQQFLDEAERSLHDAICIVKRAVCTGSVVAGGGAIEMELSRAVRDASVRIVGKQHFVWTRFARSLEVIPWQLAENSGHNPVEILSQLRKAHYGGEAQKWMGVDVFKGGVINTFEAFVWEPTLVKKNALSSATEAACLVLSVDETIKNVPSEAAQGAGAPRGNPGAAAMPMSQGGMGGMFAGAPGVRKLKGRRG